jgi:MFS family permease
MGGSSYRQLLRNRPYRAFWLGFTASAIGDAMTRVALTWFVYQETDSARAIGLLMVCFTGPVIVGGIFAGILLDRFDRRTVMMIDSVFRAAVVGAAPLIAATSRLEVWHVYGIATVYGLLMMVTLAGGPALVPDLVNDDQLPAANALEMLSFTLSGVLGPPLAGALLGFTGASSVLLLDSATYLLFALALLRIGHGRHRAGAAEASTGSYRMRDAFGLRAGNAILLATTLMFMAYNLGAGIIAVALPIFTDRTLGGGAGLFGLLLGAVAVGEVLGAAAGGARVPPVPYGVAICIAQVVAGISLVLLFLPSVAVALVSLALFGAAGAPLTIWAQTLRMRIIPPQLRGRTFALLRTIMQAGGPLGGMAGGFILPVAGITATIGIGAAIIGVPGLAGLRSGDLRRDRIGQQHIGRDGEATVREEQAGWV